MSITLNYSFHKKRFFYKVSLTLLLVISGLVESFTEVFIHNPGDLSNVMSVENHIPRQVLGRAVQLILSVTVPDIGNVVMTS